MVDVYPFFKKIAIVGTDPFSLFPFSELEVFRCVAEQVVDSAQLVIYGKPVCLVILYAGV